MPVLKRKPVPEKKLRNVGVNIRLTPEELIAISTHASAAMLNTSTWARKIILEAIAPIDPTKPMRQKRQPL